VASVRSRCDDSARQSLNVFLTPSFSHVHFARIAVISSAPGDGHTEETFACNLLVACPLFRVAGLRKGWWHSTRACAARLVLVQPVDDQSHSVVIPRCEAPYAVYLPTTLSSCPKLCFPPVRRPRRCRQGKVVSGSAARLRLPVIASPSRCSKSRRSRKGSFPRGLPPLCCLLGRKRHGRVYGVPLCLFVGFPRFDRAAIGRTNISHFSTYKLRQCPGPGAAFKPCASPDHGCRREGPSQH